MKRILITVFTLVAVLCALTSKSQTKMNAYDSEWKKIDDLINKQGLPKSALTEIDKIYARAKKENNQPQLIKALVYQMQLGAQQKENGSTSAIKKMEAEIATVQAPAKQILQSITAGMYWQYFQQNRYKFYNRTNTSDSNKEDIATWTIDDLHQKTGELFRASLQSESFLKETRLDNYDAILASKGNTRNLRPTLYDLLAHKALDYFESDERDISKPAYAFTIQENAAFDPAADFIHHKFITQDSGSLQYQALLIYQKLLAFHSEDKTHDALIDADLRRLQFVQQKAVMPEKDTVYLMALQHIRSQYEGLAAAAKAGYLMAAYHFQQYQQDNRNETGVPGKKHLVKAKEICDKTIAAFPESEGGIYCFNLLNNILQKSLELQTEKVNVPGQPFRTLVNYRNFSECNIRVIKLDKDIKDAMENRYQESFWTKLAAKPAVKQWQQKLPVTSDYENHSVEIKVDALPVGEYALFVSTNNNFGISNNLLAASYFYVSDISYVNNGKKFFVLHRQSGKPLAGASVQVLTSIYDYKDRKNKLRKAELITADKNGFAQVKELSKDDRNIRLDIKWQKDQLFMDDYEYIYTRYDGYNKALTKDVYEEQNSNVYFFTDRAIYRPGQTVYFKGIAITKNFESRKAQIISNKNITVQVQDVNGQVIDSVSLTTNNYGSINGSFQLPQQVLTGNFTIVSKAFNQSSTSFSVEEYKRPKFFVEVNAPKQSFRVNDTVSVEGSAKAYAGNAIDGATVKYRVFREVRFLYSWLYYRRFVPRSSRMEITNGDITTDAAGNFKIQFAAVPDATSDKTLDPVFDYTMQVDVTDINGETRSSSTHVQIGYKSLVLNLQTTENPVAIQDFKMITLSSRNLNNEWQDVQASVKIYPLQSPARLIRDRYWEEPDQFLYNEAEYVKLFPYDEYKNESDHRNWNKGKEVFAHTFLSKADSSINTSAVKWQQGWYIVEATANDKDGGEVKAISYIQLYNPAAKGLPAASYTWNTDAGNATEPGQVANLLSGTSAEDVFLIQETDKNIEELRPLHSKDSAPATSFEFFTLNNEKKNFQYPITEADRGGFGVNQFFVKHNRLYNNSQTIQVPWTNKRLDVKLTSFRDKTEPGSEEKWQVQISGAKGEKLAAEMLASMYDASLDQFRGHAWFTPSVWPTYYSGNEWRGSQSFSSSSSFERNGIEVTHKSFDKQYDELLSVTLGDYERRREMMAAAPMMSAKKNVSNAKNDDSVVAQGLSESEGFVQAELFNQADVVITKGTTPELPTTNNLSFRKNFNETAFFFRDLKTDADGNINMNFTIPEALTQWKLMALAHTPDLAFHLQRHLVTK